MDLSGTPVEKEVRFFFFYHAYHRSSGVYAERQGLLREFTFTPDGWIKFGDNAVLAAAKQNESKDEFAGANLDRRWEWSVFQNSRKTLSNGKLLLYALPETCGAFVGQKTTTAHYVAETESDRASSTAEAGIALIGDERNAVAALLKGNRVRVIQVKNGKETVLWSGAAGKGKTGILRMQVRNGKDVVFFYGETESRIKSLRKQPVDGTYLPPWDRALRVGLVAKGSSSGKALFEKFKIEETR